LRPENYDEDKGGREGGREGEREKRKYHKDAIAMNLLLQEDRSA